MDETGELIEFARNFGKGIGHGTRFAILMLLVERPFTVGDIAENLGVSQPTASQHLLILKNGKLVADEKKGQHVHYSLNFDYMLTGLRNITMSLEKKMPTEDASE